MEDTGATTADGTAGKDGNQEASNMVLMSGKPLHRFVQEEPRSLGIVILIFGCAEVLMGFLLTGDNLSTSNRIYIPFWQGALFLVCGVLSIYTELHPSKKMVTVCLAMYVVSILGIIVSLGFRIFCLCSLSFHRYIHGDAGWANSLVAQVTSIEGILFTSSLCVSALLIFLCTIARFALKSTHSQVIIHHVSAPRSDTMPN